MDTEVKCSTCGITIKVIPSGEEDEEEEDEEEEDEDEEDEDEEESEEDEGKF